MNNIIIIQNQTPDSLVSIKARVLLDLKVLLLKKN